MITVNTARGQKTEESIFRFKELRVKYLMEYSQKYLVYSRHGDYCKYNKRLRVETEEVMML
jgi:hypothetical protein